jgi:SAM-dependent methyltransferase
MSAQLKPAPGYRELLLGAGTRQDKRITWPEVPSTWTNLTTLDIMPSNKPDVLHDLDVLPYPFADNEFDEIHAYEILEHCGKQGDWRFFFAQFAEFYRILKPGGYFAGSSPMWDQVWAWGDPGHTRIISAASLMFLDQQFYADQVGKTACSDYRDFYKADFKVLSINENAGVQFYFVLQSHKK